MGRMTGICEADEPRSCGTDKVASLDFNSTTTTHTIVYPLTNKLPKMGSQQFERTGRKMDAVEIAGDVLLAMS